MQFLKSVLLLVWLGQAVAQDDGHLYFSVNPAHHSVVEGSPVRLRCEVGPSTLKVGYYWAIDGQPLVPSPRRHQIGSDLYITRVNRILDSGNFVCVGYHNETDQSIESSPAKIDIQWITRASVQLQLPKFPVLVKAGQDIELRCHVDGSGDMRYEWFKNGRSVSKNVRAEMKKRKLHIYKASPEDNGLYTCMARNEAGSSPIGDGFPLIVSGNDSAVIKVIPENLIVKRGEPASLHCEYENADAVQWFFKEIGPLESDDERTIFENGTLLVHAAEHKDQGFYSCHGLRDDNVQIYAAELQIAYLRDLTVNSFEPALLNQLAIIPQDQEFQVSCLEPSGLPPVKVYWKDPTGHIISDVGQVRVQDNTLIIDKANEDEDNGNYTCLAENLAGESEMFVQIVVSTPPSLISSPESMIVTEYDPVSLTCSYSGMDPPVTYTRWLKLGEPLKETGGPTRHRITEHRGNATLHFKAVELSDSGHYQCEIMTKGFSAVLSDRAFLTVKEKLKFSPTPVNKRLELGSVGKVPCKAQGDTAPTVKWIREDGGEDFPEHIQDIGGTLHFNGVTEEDKGRYTCVATNAQGSINHTISIDVVIAPKFTIQPKNPTEAVEGYPIMLHCAAEGDPKPTIQWDKDSRMNNLNNPRFEVFPNGSLYIKEVYLSDEGKYGCTAGNSGGLKREEVVLYVKASGDGYRSDVDSETGDDGSMMTKTVTITLSAAAAYMILVVGLMLYCRYRRRRRKQQYLQEQAEEKLENGEVQEEQTELKETSHKSNGSKKKENHESHKSDGADTAQSQGSNQSKKSKSNYDKIAASRSNLKDLKPLGRGEFGDIFASKYQVDGDKETLVMVKSITNTKDEGALQEFKRQLDLFHKLNHENVAKLIGLCRDEEPDYMILEYTDWGDLKQFLIASRKDDSSSPARETKPRAPQLSVAQILSLSNQAAKGLKYIADNRLVHKDIAARNCLIASNLTIKISLSCMTKEPYHQEYTKHRNQVIPLRWLPYEAVYEDEYSTKSDIYSFSCLMWEIFHQGELPFNKLNDDSVLSQLKAQTLIWKAHKAAPPALQELQNSCWAHDPRDRPTFDEVVLKIGEIVVDSCL